MLHTLARTVTSATCSSVAIGTTIWRLYIRRGRFWYDDGFASVSLVALLLQIAAVFMHVPNPCMRTLLSHPLLLNTLSSRLATIDQDSCVLSSGCHILRHDLVGNKYTSAITRPVLILFFQGCPIVHSLCHDPPGSKRKAA
jgi:hypothetical protein